MMINTSKYDKSFIFLVYNVIMIISTVSFNITAEPNISNTDKYAPDYDMIQIEDLPDYYKYYFRPSVYAGQLKIFPVMFFRSIYNCKYLVLPDLKDRYDYGEYSQKFYERLLNLNHQYKTSNKIIKKQENNYDKLLANYSKVTKEAYDAVKKYEDPVEMDNRDSNRKLKDEAVQTYLNTEMEISSDEELHDEFKYIYANYEVHAYPTEKIFYPSTVRQSENDNSLQTLFFNCNNLNAGEYHEVMFLYKFISIIKEDESFFTTTILNILITLGQCVPVKLHPLLKDYTGILNKEETKNSDKGESEKEEIGNSDNVCKDYESETEMLKKKFIVNNENEMSYLVRLKIMGYVGFDFTNTDLYRKKKDFRAGYYIDMDINTKTELSEDFKSDKDGI